MSKQSVGKISRRKFVKLSGGAVAAAGMTSAFLFPTRALAQQKTLKILQWSHFVPGYDKWFDNTFTKEWGAKHNTNVIVDHIAIAEINARAAAEVSAKKGHDLVMFLSPPAAYEKQVIDHRDIYAEVERKHGKKVSLAEKSTLNPKTKKYFAFSDSFVPDPGNYRQDLWSQVGFPHGPDTYNDLLVGAKRIKQKFGNPCGVGLSQELDTNMAMRAVLWSYGSGTGRAQFEEHDRSGEVRPRVVSADRDTGSLFVGPVIEQPRHLVGETLIRAERDLGDALGGERQSGDVEADSASSGAQGSGASHRRGTRHVVLCDLGIRGEQGKCAAVPGRSDRRILDRVQRQRVLQLPMFPDDGSRHQGPAGERSEGGAEGQVCRSRRRPHVGDERRISGLRNRGDR